MGLMLDPLLHQEGSLWV